MRAIQTDEAKNEGYAALPENRYSKIAAAYWRSLQRSERIHSSFYLQNRQRASLFVAAFIALSGSVLFCHKAASPRLKQEAPYGRYSARRVLDMADPLYLRITENGEGWTSRAEYHEGALPGNEYWHTWNVLYTDDRGDDSASLIWNADTGQLIAVSTGTSLKSLRLLKRSMDSEEAVKISAFWLKELGMIASQNPRWHLASLPQHAATAWSLRFASGNKRISITVDASNGALRRVWKR